jgi:hypothetical protein
MNISSVLLLIVFAQTAVPKFQNPLTTPQTPLFPLPQLSPLDTFKAPPTFHLSPPSVSTTPNLTPETEIHAQMERDIGGQQEAVYDLKSRVSGLEEKREKSDRPDIDDLKSFRTQIQIWATALVSILGTVGSLLYLFRGFLWEAGRPKIVSALLPSPPIRGED